MNSKPVPHMHQLWLILIIIFSLMISVILIFYFNDNQSSIIPSSLEIRDINTKISLPITNHNITGDYFSGDYWYTFTIKDLSLFDAYNPSIYDSVYNHSYWTREDPYLYEICVNSKPSIIEMNIFSIELEIDGSIIEKNNSYQDDIIYIKKPSLIQPQTIEQTSTQRIICDANETDMMNKLKYEQIKIDPNNELSNIRLCKQDWNGYTRVLDIVDYFIIDNSWFTYHETSGGSSGNPHHRYSISLSSNSSYNEFEKVKEGMCTALFKNPNPTYPSSK